MPSRKSAILAAQPEVFVSSPEISDAVSRAVRQGNLRKIGPRLYTKVMKGPLEAIVRRNLWYLVNAYFPGAVLAGRTAALEGPAPDGAVFVTSNRKASVKLPGAVIKSYKGHPPLKDDLPFADGLFKPSPARTFLGNAKFSRRREGSLRNLTRSELESRIQSRAQIYGLQSLIRDRERARAIAPVLGLEKEFPHLDRLIEEAVENAKESSKLVNPTAFISGVKSPFDQERMDMFREMAAELRLWAEALTVQPVPAMTRSTEEQRILAFFDSYFSNYIEGTEFKVSEAEDIIFRGEKPEGRTADAHDIIGAWRTLSSPEEMARTPQTPKEFLYLLRVRHASVMAGRPDMAPGSLKDEPNRVGSRDFVEPDLTEGTLERAFEIYQSLEHPLARAVMVKFITTEVHPFADGNGRVSRIMMNSELAAAGCSSIVIPLICRDAYLNAAAEASVNGRLAPMANFLAALHKWTAAVAWADVAAARAVMESCGAFLDSRAAKAKGLSLKMPDGTDVFS